MKPYKMLDITAVLLVVGFLTYAGVAFLKPDAVLSDTETISVSPPPAQKADSADLLAEKSAQLAENLQTDFPDVPVGYEPSGDESEFYISSSHAYMIDEAKQSLPALTAPVRSPSGSSGTTGTSSAGGSSPSSSSLSGGSSGSGGSGGGGSGGGSPATDSGSADNTSGNGTGSVITEETEKPLPEWIQQEGIRAGFFTASCDTDYNLKMKAVGLNTAIITRFIYDIKHMSIILKDYQSHAHVCQQIGMHMFASYAWQPGNEWKAPQYRSVVFSDGTSGLFPCPLDETFWQQHLINTAVRIAGISLEDSESIMDGIFLDMEMYGTEALLAEKRGYSSDTCFCDFCFSGYIADRTEFKSLPSIREDRRKSWLEQNGFLSDYYVYLKERVEAKAELLKNSVHEVNPQFLFGVYPRLNDENWVRSSVIRALGRNSYPAISFTTDTYGYYLNPWGADRIPADLSAYFEEYDINGAYVAGYMFSKYTSAEIGYHLIQSCQKSQGYWLFDMSQLLEEGVPEGDPLAGGTRSDYMRAIERANGAVR